LEFAALVGARRRAGALNANLSDRYGNVDKDPWGLDIEGAAAEMAVAKALGRYWHPSLHVQRDEGDVASYQVRSTTLSEGCLLIKEGDGLESIFIFVVGTAPVLSIPGWIRARDGRRDEWWRTVRGRSAWFVPQSALRPIPKKGEQHEHT